MKALRIAAAGVALIAGVLLVAPVTPARAESMTDILARHDAKKAAEAAAQKAQADATTAAILAQPRPSTAEPTLPGTPTIILDRPLKPEETPAEREARLKRDEADIIAVETLVRRIHSGVVVKAWFDDALVLHRVWLGPEGRWHEAGGSFDYVSAD